MMATERKMVSALAKAPAMPVAVRVPRSAPAPSTRSITANEFASTLTRMAFSTHAAVRQLGQQQQSAETAQLHSCVESCVRALCQQLLHASKWIVGAEARATAAEKHVAARDAEVVALRKALDAKTEKTETTSEASACTLASDSESAHSTSPSESATDSDDEDEGEDPVAYGYHDSDREAEKEPLDFMRAYARAADMLENEQRSHGLTLQREAALAARLAYANAETVLVLAELTRVREEHGAALHQLQGALHSSQQELADAQISLRKYAASKRELKQDLAQSQYDSAQLCQKVQSLERLVEIQDKRLCRGDAQRLALRSDVARLTTIKDELEKERDELMTRANALEVTEADLHQELETVLDAAAESTSQHEELFARMQSELVDLRSEVLYFAQQANAGSDVTRARCGRAGGGDDKQSVHVSRGGSLLS